MRKINEFLNSLKEGESFYVKIDNDISKSNIYIKGKIMEKRELYGANDDVFDLTVYRMHYLKLYNDKYGFTTFVLNHHNGESDAENNLMRSSFNNFFFKFYSHNKYDNYYDVYTEKEFEYLNEKEKNKMVKEYVDYCGGGSEINLPEMSNQIYLSVI